MGMFSFIKEAGEKLFGHKEVEDAAAKAALPNTSKRKTWASKVCTSHLMAPPARSNYKALHLRKKPAKKQLCAAAMWVV